MDKTWLLGYGLMLLNSVIISFGQYFIKLGVNTIERFSLGQVFFNRFLLGGVGLYLIYFVLQTVAYRYGPYGVLFAISSLAYIWTLLLGWKFLKEKINWLKTIGILLIIAGTAMIANF